MIVDAHVHTFFPGSDPENYLRGCARVGAAFFGRTSGRVGDPGELYESFMGVLADPTGEKLLDKMAKAKVDRAVLLPLDLWAFRPEEERAPGSTPAAEKNAQYRDLAATYPDKLVAGFGVDPRRADALERLDAAAKADPPPACLKLHPSVGYYPDDPEFDPLYAACVDHGLPVVVHAGNQPAPAFSKYCRPVYLDSVAAKFPDLGIVVAHCGHGWWREAVDVASSKPNLHVDFSGWQVAYRSDPDYFYEALRFALDVLGPWRVFWGTDGSLTDVVLEPRRWLRALTRPKSKRGFQFSESEVEVVAGKAAAKFYGL
ncbi:MAG: hypothetical protein Kow0069_29160 [Promethearchaeota archaeon]